MTATMMATAARMQPIMIPITSIDRADGSNNIAEIKKYNVTNYKAYNYTSISTIGI